jgi:hypothetical protein
MNRSVIVLTALAALALGLGVYQHVEIRGLRARLAQAAEAPVTGGDGSAAVALRLRALTQLSSTSPAPASAVAAESAHEAVAPGSSAAPPAANRGLPLSPADQLLAHEAAKQLLDAARAKSLDFAENRRPWIQELATAQGLSPDQTARLGGVFEAEFQRREQVIAEVKHGSRTRKDGRAELQRLEATSNERARAILGADLFENYLARRVASGIHDDGSAN